MAGFLSKFFGGGDKAEPEAAPEAPAPGPDETAPHPVQDAATNQVGNETQPQMPMLDADTLDGPDEPTMMISMETAEAAEKAEFAGKVNWLVGVGGDMVGKRFHIGDRAVTIGRATSNYIQTSDAQASRTHCQIRPEGDTLIVQDMNSSNGTLVNGNKTTEIVLKEGDTISIGAAAFTYRRTLEGSSDDAEDASQASRVAGGVATDQTMGVQGLNSIIAETVKACDGDLEQAAQIIGCDVDFIQAMMNQ